MTKKYTLHDLICLHLAAHGDAWVPSYSLTKVQTAKGWIGTSGDRRARELAEAFAGPLHERHEVDGMLYGVERKQVGKYAEYRITERRVKPHYEYRPVVVDGQTVMREVLMS